MKSILFIALLLALVFNAVMAARIGAFYTLWTGARARARAGDAAAGPAAAAPPGKHRDLERLFASFSAGSHTDESREKRRARRGGISDEDIHWLLNNY